MTIKEQTKILNDKVKQNKVDYDLYRQNAKISALSRDNLDKYEYLTGEDLGYRPDPVQKAKFEYSPLGQVFNKELDSNEKQEGLLKSLKNIEGKSEQQLDLIKDQGDRQVALINEADTEKIDFYDKKTEALKYWKLKLIKKLEVLKIKKNYYLCSDGKAINDFVEYKSLNDFGRGIQDGDISLDVTRVQQDEMFNKWNKLKNHNVLAKGNIKNCC